MNQSESLYYQHRYPFIPLGNCRVPPYPAFPAAVNSRQMEMLKIHIRSAENLSPIASVPPSFREFSLFHYEGSRREYEILYFRQRRRLTSTAILYWQNPEDSGIKRDLENILWALCDEFTWALPAHLPDGGLMPGYPHYGELDLFNCETGFALAEILFLHQDRLDPAICERVEAEVFRRVLTPFLQSEPGRWEWEGLENNWSAVCAGSIGCAALYLLQDSSRRAELEQLLLRLLPPLDCYMEGFGPEGVSQEGLAYWTYGLYFFVSFSDLLKKCTGGEVDLLTHPYCRNIAEFQHKCYLTASLNVSFSDASNQEPFRPGLTCYLAEHFPGVQIPPESRIYREEDPCSRWAPAFRDILWAKECSQNRGTPEPEGQRFYAFKEAQWFIAPTRDSHSLAFAAKGGHNDEPHNHNDLGSFMLVADDQVFLSDLGAGEYSKQYFGEGQYQILCKSSRGHSLPILDGQEQTSGRHARSRLLESRIEPDSWFISLDLTTAYPRDLADSLVRNFIYDFKRQSLEICDLYRGNAHLTERFISTVEPELLPRGDLLLRGQSMQLRICFPRHSMNYSLHKELHIDHEGHSCQIYCMDFEETAGIEKSQPQTFPFQFKLESLL